jgi:hypothetical protein
MVIILKIKSIRRYLWVIKRRYFQFENIRLNKTGLAPKLSIQRILTISYNHPATRGLLYRRARHDSATLANP